MQSPPVFDDAGLLPFLEYYPEDDGPPKRTLCHRFPFILGRGESSEFVIYSWEVSRQHAMIVSDGDGYTIRDMNSTNGTFVNGQQVDVVPLRDGDIIHIASKEFRFGLMPRQAPLLKIDTHPSALRQGGVPLGIIYGRDALQEAIREQKVRIVFQPVVDLKGGDVVGYEALGRGTHHELSPNPADLFRLAGKCGMAGQLSTLFRVMAFKEAAQLAGPVCFFFNIHPTEMMDKDFVASLGEAAANFGGGGRLVLEVHEDFVSDTSAMRRLRDQLNSVGIGLAYDDVGAGQSRLNELAEVPPDFLKLDMKLIRGIHEATARQEIVRALTDISARLGVGVIAEGVETIEEANCCRELGCDWAQGFLFGRPTPASQLHQTKCVDMKRPVLPPLMQKRRCQ